MKRTYTVTIWNQAPLRVVTRIKIAAVSVEQALDKAQAKSRALNRLPEVPARFKADYLVCFGFLRVVA